MLSAWDSAFDQMNRSAQEIISYLNGVRDEFAAVLNHPDLGTLKLAQRLQNATSFDSARVTNNVADAIDAANALAKHTQESAQSIANMVGAVPTLQTLKSNWEDWRARFAADDVVAAVSA